MPEFLQRLTPAQRKILMFGVPVVVVAAIWSLSRNPSGDQEAGEDTTSGGDTGAPPTVGRGPGGVITGGTGSTVDSGALSEFLNSVGDALEQYRSEGTEAINQLRAENDVWRDELEQMLANRGNQESHTPGAQPVTSPPPPTNQPKPVGQITLINTSSGRAAFTGPSGEGGLATAPTKADIEKYGGGWTSWRMPDGRTAWYQPGQHIDAGNVGALQNFAGS